MPLFFLPGPFADADMRRAALRDQGAAPPTPDTLARHGLRRDARGAAVALVSDPGAVAPGAALDVDAGDADRLAFAFAALGGATRAVTVRLGSGRLAQAYVAPAGAAPRDPWPEAPDPEWRAHLAEALAEIMDHYGRIEPEAARALMLGVSYRALARARGAAARTPATLRRTAAPADVEPLALARPYANYFAVEERTLRHRRFDGAMSEPLMRAVFTMGDAVTVLPYDARRDAVLLIEQFRAGPLARHDPNPWMLETVAGRCDAGEDAEATARREALEEAGVTLGRLEQIADYYPSPGAVAEHLTTFVGEADLGAAGGLHGLDAEAEDIRAVVVPRAEAQALVASGEVNNGPLLVALLWLAANAEALRDRWGAG